MDRPLRSLLFVPGHRVDRFAKALAAGADAVVVDLEDAVAPADKDAARAALAGWLDSNPLAAGAANGRAPRLIARINGPDTAWFEADLALVGHPGLDAVMLAKAEDPSGLARLRRAGARALLPLIESARGVARLREIAAAPGVERLAFGTLDFQVDLGMRDAHEDDLLVYRTQFVVESRLAGIAGPIDGVSTAIDDATRLAEDVLRARRLGFAGKLCIHPRQVAQVNALFAPNEAEIAWATRVLEAAAAAGGAAVAVDGKMVDKPVMLRAEAILREAGVR